MPDEKSSFKGFFTFKNNKDYYGANTGRKVVDFLFGFCVSVIGFVLNILIMIAGQTVPYNSGVQSIITVASMINYGLSSAVWIVALIAAIIGRRKYLIIGLLVIPALLLMLFGACLIILAGIGIGY